MRTLLMRRYVKCCRCAPSTRASRRGRREDVCRTSRRRSLRAEPPWPSWGVIATLRLWCATLAAHAVALPPPSTPRRMSRPLALALACAIAASTSHLQLALASPASATSSLSRLVRSRPFSRISASSTASAAKALHPSPADSRHLRARPLPQECSAATLTGARGLQKQPRPSARRSARPTRACGDAKCASPTRSANSRSPCSATSAATHAKPR